MSEEIIEIIGYISPTHTIINEIVYTSMVETKIKDELSTEVLFHELVINLVEEI